ncbi:septal ring lytic transglycosylase RlpA family protein [Erythrobacter sp. R86502]|uniref:septal ring lytic transglycosylase RlpA family protein n=1 Tax=Erythrobacter sp. R86502 TaxID=3093846 RepID=UPI0036D3E55A
MSTRLPIRSHTARSTARFGIHALAIAGLIGLAPIAASSATTAEAESMTPSPATSAAIVEIVPVQPAPEAAPMQASDDNTAASAPVETRLGRGSASYYAARFNGRRTASGERFDNSAMTAAHRTLPFGTRLRVTNPANGRSVVVRVNDRGPFTRGRLIDVSRAAADELGMVARGHADVELAVIEG